MPQRHDKQLLKLIDKERDSISGVFVASAVHEQNHQWNQVKDSTEHGSHAKPDEKHFSVEWFSKELHHGAGCKNTENDNADHRDNSFVGSHFQDALEKIADVKRDKQEPRKSPEDVQES